MIDSADGFMTAPVNRAAGLRFLQVEIETGFTFARIAQGTGPDLSAKFQRNLKNARKAYDSAMRFRRTAQLDEGQKVAIDANLEQLKKMLQTLGEDI